MPRPRTGFTIYTEQPQVAHGRAIFYYKVKVGAKYQKRSTGIIDDGTETARRKAEAVVAELFKKDRLLPRSRLTLESFAPDFWVWGKCRYIKARVTRDPKAFGMEHADNLRRLYQKQILPVFGKFDLEKITTEMIDDFITSTIDSGVSSQTASHIMQAFRAPLSEAKRLKYIAVNPISDCMPITVRGKRKGAFTPEEAKVLLDQSTVPVVWACRDARFTQWEKHPYDPWQHWALSILGACTGRRVNEIVALKAGDIDWEKSEINFHSSIGRITGLKDGTKTGEGSNIPMDAEILEMIKPILATEGFIFPGKKSGTHINYRTVTKQLHNSLRKIGISEKTCVERSLGYHSWRGFFNTRARAAHLSDPIIQAITEHKTLKMTDHYTHFLADDLKGIRAVQRSNIGLI